MVSLHSFTSNSFSPQTNVRACHIQACSVCLTRKCVPVRRLHSAKLLIEAGLLHECARILKTVQDENDSIAELWYLYCFVYRLMGKESRVQVLATLS